MNRATCTICSDFLVVSDVTACPCGHTFHHQCIMTWKQRSSTCPQCRVKFKQPIKLFFDLNTLDDSIVDSADLKNQLTEMKLKIKENDRKMGVLQEEQAGHLQNLCERTEEVEKMKESLNKEQGYNAVLKKQVNYLQKFQSDSKKARLELQEMEKRLQSFANIKELVNGDRHDVEDLLKKYNNSPEAFAQVVKSFNILKKQYDQVKEGKKTLEGERRAYKKQAHSATIQAQENKKQMETLTKECMQLTETNRELEQRLESHTESDMTCSQHKRSSVDSPPPLQQSKRSRVDETRDSLVLVRDTDDEDSFSALAQEFNMDAVQTTSTADHRMPLRDHTNRAKFNVPPPKPTAFSSRVRQGYNGMGGQSRVLVLPKRTHANNVPKMKQRPRLSKDVVKNNTKISQFF